MSEESTNYNLLLGAAIAAGVVGVLSSLAHSKELLVGQKSVIDKQGSRADSSVRSPLNRSFLIGGIAGGLIGAAAALLLTPQLESEPNQDVSSALGALDEISQRHLPEQKGTKRKRKKKINIEESGDRIKGDKVKVSPKRRISSKRTANSAKEKVLLSKPPLEGSLT